VHCFFLNILQLCAFLLLLVFRLHWLPRSLVFTLILVQAMDLFLFFLKIKLLGAVSDQCLALLIVLDFPSGMVRTLIFIV
jgi:hypothetical protein